MTAKLRIDVWSDVACPWCWVGKRRFERALERFAHKDEVEVVWRAFELDPSAPKILDGDYAERLGKKYGTSTENARRMIAQMAETGRADGLELRFDRIRAGSTFDAHRVLHLAKDRGVQDAVKERFFRGYFSEGSAMGDAETLVALAADAGLDAEETRAALASDAHASAVRADEAEAAELGIRGVPFFLLGGRLAVSGAQPDELFVRALDRAWSDLAPEGLQEGAACTTDGCG